MIGDRIELVSMGADPDPMPSGARGVIVMELNVGTPYEQVNVRWDCGRGLMLVPGEDQWRVLSPDEVQAEFEAGGSKVDGRKSRPEEGAEAPEGASHAGRG